MLGSDSIIIVINIIKFCLHSPPRSMQATNFKLGVVCNGTLPGKKLLC